MADLRIVDAPEIPTNSITGEEKIPTGGNGNYSISLDSLADYTKTKKDLADNTSVDNKVNGVRQELNNHIEDLLNPHQVTKVQIGLGNVDNTADLDKPVSNSTQAAIISAISPKADKTYVDNALSNKSDKTYVDDQLTLKANKVDVYTKVETYTKQESSDLVNNSISTALTPVNSSLDLAKRGVLNRYDSSLTYNMGERVILSNGDIVKSTIDGNTNDPNVDMVGWVNHEDDQTKIINKAAPLETLAESVDATPFLQSLINAMPDGMTLDLLGKTFRVKKNTGFTSDYPNGDQPCLVLKANNITITNGKLIVKEHGQGILDSFGENLSLVGVTLQGSGNFPLLDGNTGRGEKGFTNGGYYNAALHNSGMPKNNSVDTSGLSTGGYGGNFPQWGGGTAPTWGTWNGGFIFNEGSGLTVKGGSAVVRYCDISGFNGYGCLAEGGSLKVRDSEIHHIYTAGIHGKVIAGKVVDFLDVQRNNIHHIGHPDALNTNLHADPGYGVSTSNGGTTDSGVRKYIVENNNITFCRRKGVDAHHGYDISIQNNLIEDCGTGVEITIYALGKNPIRTLINGNTVRRIHHSLKDATIGISISCNANLSRFTGSAFVTNNKVEGVGLLKSVYDVYKAEWGQTAAGIVVLGVHDATITGNTVDSTDDYVCDIGIADGLNTALNTPVIDISHNTIRGAYKYGIFSIAGTSTTSNATISNRGGIIGNKLDVTRRIDTAVNTYNIYSGPAVKVANNILVERTSTMQNYYQPNLEGQSVVFDTDVVAKNATYIRRSELIAQTYAPVTNGETGQLRFTLPAGATIRNVSITELSNVKSATSQDIRWRTGSTNPSSYLAISFYKIEGGSVVDVPVGDLTGGALTIRLDF